jgi:hypothetical protein
VVPAGFHALNHEDVENFAPLNTSEGQNIVEEVIKRIEIEFIIFDNIMSSSGLPNRRSGGRRAQPSRSDRVSQAIRSHIAVRFTNQPWLQQELVKPIRAFCPKQAIHRAADPIGESGYGLHSRPDI